MYRLALSLTAAALLAAPAVAQEGPEKQLDAALVKAKKEKKYVSVVFTQFG